MRTHLDLFSGIGGFSLAARWAGFTTIGFVEIDPWCQRVLAKNFPHVPIHGDVRTLTAAAVRGWIGGAQGVHHAHADRSVSQAWGGDGLGEAAPTGTLTRPGSDGLHLLTGGYPCQPFSHAGKRMGAEDDRHLWPEMRRLIADLRPRWVLAENVAGHVSMGLDDVLADLETLSYACGATVVPACAVGAPHRRDRVWIVAHAGGGQGKQRYEPDVFRGWTDQAEQIGMGGGGAGAEGDRWVDDEWFVAHANEQGEPTLTVDGGAGCRQLGAWDVAHAEDGGVRRGGSPGEAGQPARGGEVAADANRHDGTRQRHGEPVTLRSATGAPESERDTPTVDLLEALRGMGDETARLPGWVVGPGIDPWSGKDWEAGVSRTTVQEVDRVNKLKALGNSIVPQVAYEFLRVMNEDTP